ncbi:MAG: 50S ribosomal protein L24 [Euryarchaeota archaeon]|nr:50S ribosomal protein L24 [Euryarchaeota archaeon]
MMSKKARKQRKALYNAPNHVRSAMISSHLDEPLRKEYKMRAVRVIKGDTVRVMRGDEDVLGQEGKVQEVETKTGHIIIEGVTIAKADGTQTARPIHSSNVLVTKLNLTDPRRKDKLTQAKEVSQ